MQHTAENEPSSSSSTNPEQDPGFFFQASFEPTGALGQPQQQILDELSKLHVRSSSDLKREGGRNNRKVLRFATEPAQKPVKRVKEDRCQGFELTPSAFDARKKMKRSLRSCLMKRRRKHGITKRVRFSSSSPGTDLDSGHASGSSWGSPTSATEDRRKNRATILRTRKKRFKEAHPRSLSPTSPLFRRRELREGEVKTHPTISINEPSFMSRLHATVYSPPAPRCDDEEAKASMEQEEEAGGGASSAKSRESMSESSTVKSTWRT